MLRRDFRPVIHGSGWRFVCCVFPDVKEALWPLFSGVNILVTRHIAIRPAVAVTMVFRHRDTYTMTAGVVRLAYHFENHPVTPAKPR